MELVMNEDIHFLCELWAKEDCVSICFKVDTLIVTLSQELITKNLQDVIIKKRILRILSFRMSYSKSIDGTVILSCKQLVNHITKSVLQLHLDSTSEKQLDIQLLLDIVQLSLEYLVIAQEDEFCVSFIEVVQKTIKSSFCVHPQHTQILNGLSVLECLLNALDAHTKDNSMYLMGTCNVIQSDSFYTLMVDLMLESDDKIILSFILFNIMPKLIQVSKSQTVVSILWKKINSPEKSASISLTQKLFILCALADFYTTKSSDDFSVIRDKNFWEIVQKGLLSNDGSLRKQGLYLLKRSLDVICRFNIQLDLELFSWNCVISEHLNRFWEKMIILLEILEEKQSHLVIPIITDTLKLNEDLKNVHASWFLVVYTRLLSHDSLQVAKLGILFFLKLNVNSYAHCSYTYLIKILFQRLNDMLVYSCHSNNIEWSDVDLALREWFTNIMFDVEVRVKFYSVVVEAMASISWGTIPLFHVVHNMSITPEAELFDESNMTIFCEFLKEAVRTQNIFIRGAVQCAILTLLTKHTNKSINMLSIATVLSALRKNECCCRGLQTWEMAKQWVQPYKNQEGAEILVQILISSNNLSLKAKARTLVLLIDAGLIDIDEKFQNEMEHYFSVLNDCYKRPYASVDESDKCLELILFILEESKSCSSKSDLKNDKLIVSILPFTINEIIPYIRKRLLDDINFLHFNSVSLYTKVLYALSENNFFLLGLSDAETLNERAVELYNSTNCSIGHRYLSLKVTLWFISLFSKAKECYNLESNIKLYCLSLIKDPSLKAIKNIENSSRNQEDRSRFISGSINTLWSIIQQCISTEIISFTEILRNISAVEFIQMAIDSIEIGGRDSMVPILTVIESVLPVVAKYNVHLVEQFLEFTWKSCFELRKVAAFWPSIAAWIKMTFSSQLIIEEDLQKTIANFSEKIFSQGDTVSGLTNALLTHLKQELKDARSVELMLPTLTSALLFGPVLRRDQRIENDTCTLIRSLGNDYAVNILIPQDESRSSQQVRACALATLLASASFDEGPELLVKMVQNLLAKDTQLTARRTRYHGDSLHHRVKHRILQALLVMESLLAKCASSLTKSCVVELVKWSSVSLQGESQQPSVRYMLEWLLVRSLLHSPQLLDIFWSIFGQASEERTGCICSFISVAYHLANTLRDELFIDRCVTEILPWCMAQHFNVRLYAQVVLQKLWPLNSKVAAKYNVIRQSLLTSLNQGNAVRNAEKLKTDFYFTAFHPLDHFSLETIFWELPRLSNISRDEWVSLATLRESCAGLNMSVPLANADDSLKQFTVATWVAKATEPDVGVDMEASGLQKKFVPWKGMRAELGIHEEGGTRSPSRTELVVVASLIDKVPNLGGLARSCEVFAADSLVVASLEHTKDKLFSTLSMSAEKHIDIVEVKPHDLGQYLREKKKSGYALVGAEQTASSVSLESYKFPTKCLLLLGNEKEGIPVTVLPLLDVCVQVPQLGLVRSLNVHVTGALFIWEYTKQYTATSSETAS